LLTTATTNGKPSCKPLYWSCLLKEDVNYVKINDDLLNLIPKIEFLKNHPNKAKKIADNARDLAMKVLNFNFQDKYIVFILQKINQFNLKYLYL
jgi:hypothetical protein